MEIKERLEFVFFHIAFLCLALLGVLLAKNQTFAILLLVLFYLISTVIFLRFRKYFLWQEIFYFSLGLNVLMILPDWFLAAVLGTIEFPEDSFRLGLVSLYMLGMWTIPFTMMLFLRWLEEEYSQSKAIVLSTIFGLVIFASSEFILPLIPAWEPKNVFTIGSIAIYVLPRADTLLCLNLWFFV